MKKLSFILLAVPMLLLNACATTGQQQANVERITPEQLAKLVPPPAASVSLDEIVADSKAGKTPDEIIQKIQVSNSRYDLSAQQIIALHAQGVNEKVLDYIQQSNEKAKQNALADEINKREKAKNNAQAQLARERELLYRSRGELYGTPFYPFYYPYGPYHPPYFSWGARYGYPYPYW